MTRRAVGMPGRSTLRLVGDCGSLFSSMPAIAAFAEAAGLRQRILVVDDGPDLRRTARSAFVAARHGVAAAASGGEASLRSVDERSSHRVVGAPVAQPLATGWPSRGRAGRACPSRAAEARADSGQSTRDGERARARRPAGRAAR